ncbi:hypothetical protein CDL12_00796 [Handroanthus impetiginosus]|uniref:Uncharacterized protein n=1 Tax=Handroanthus impetiginosus TaxID=429701 RepID=A0A2G9I9L7_9LAMI|nr:hypothetical protein CDL12_00796 [Handroanthus impetiginosus]
MLGITFGVVIVLGGVLSVDLKQTRERKKIKRKEGIGRNFRKSKRRCCCCCFCLLYILVKASRAIEL